MTNCNYKLGSIITLLIISLPYIRYTGCRLEVSTISDPTDWLLTDPNDGSQMDNLKQTMDPKLADSGMDDGEMVPSEMDPIEMDPPDSSEPCAKTYYYEEGTPCDAASCKAKCNDYCWNLAQCCCGYVQLEGCKCVVQVPFDLTTGGCTRDEDDNTCFQKCGSYCKNPYTCCCGRGFNREADGTCTRLPGY